MFTEAQHRNINKICLVRAIIEHILKTTPMMIIMQSGVDENTFLGTEYELYPSEMLKSIYP